MSVLGNLSDFLSYVQKRGYHEARLSDEIVLQKTPWSAVVPTRTLHLDLKQTLQGSVFYLEKGVAYEGPDPRQRRKRKGHRREIILMYLGAMHAKNGGRNARRDGFADIVFP